jgi:kumamolisin
MWDPESQNFLNSVEIPELPRVEAPGRTNPVRFTISFKTRNQQDYLERLSNGEKISESALDEAFLPLRTDYNAVLDWLKRRRVRILSTNSSRLSITGETSVTNAESLLRIGMVNLIVDGTNFFTATNAPSLPAAIGRSVLGIEDLQPFGTPHKHDLTPAATNSGAALWPAGALQRYHVGNQPFTGGGQTIALLTDTLPDPADVESFWASCNLRDTAGRLSLINVALDGEKLPSDATEATLDSEWAGAVASGAKIRVYAVGSFIRAGGWTKVVRGLDRIYSDARSDSTLRVVSMSFGAGEQDLHSDEVTLVMNQLGLLVSTQVTVFAASGDEGDTPHRNYPNETDPILQVEFPASSPLLTGVGGTSIRWSGTKPVEDGWSKSGGGISTFNAPKWQRGRGIAENSAKRLVPDVSLIADPAVNLQYQGHLIQRGGTSLGAPVWAAFAAMINEALKKNDPKNDLLGPLNVRIYPMLGHPPMVDILTGANGAYAAGVGYDMVSGIGVPDFPQLLSELSR